MIPSARILWARGIWEGKGILAQLCQELVREVGGRFTGISSALSAENRRRPCRRWPGPARFSREDAKPRRVFAVLMVAGLARGQRAALSRRTALRGVTGPDTYSTVRRRFLAPRQRSLTIRRRLSTAGATRHGVELSVRCGRRRQRLSSHQGRRANRPTRSATDARRELSRGFFRWPGGGGGIFPRVCGRPGAGGRSRRNGVLWRRGL